MRRVNIGDKRETKNFKKEYFVICPKCNIRANLQYSQNLQKYIYICPVCQAKVAAHFSDLAPMGFPANRKTRQLRYEAHIMLNTLAKLQGMSRKQSYDWLAKKLGKNKADTHIGNFTVDELYKCIKLLDRCIKSVNSAQQH